jgi:hypothetical protein
MNHRFRKSRSLASLGMTGITCCMAATSIVVRSAAVAAQGIQRSTGPNPALRQSTVDAAALGVVGRAFLEYGLGDDEDWTGSAGLALAGGMLRGSYTQQYPKRYYGLGYAHPIASQSFGWFGTLGSGVDFSAAYQANLPWSTGPRAMRLTTPLYWRLGSPRSVSLTPYLAPYAELGSEDVFRSGCQFIPGSCRIRRATTYSTGLGGGFEFAAWRTSLAVGVMGVPVRLNQYGPWRASAGFRLRF